MQLKTLEDLNAMHAQRMQVFSDKYNYYIREMENDALTKENGKELVKERLKEFDEEARNKILLDLYKRGIEIV